MNKHSIVKTTLGVGLMAASMATLAAAVHTFTQPSLYYKIDGVKVNYIAFLPSSSGVGGFQGAGGVVMLDLYNSGTISSWHYAVGGSADAAAAGAAWTQASATLTAVNYPITSAATNGISFAANYLSLGQTASVSLAFVQNPTISSQACDVTFAASIDTNDYLLFTNFTIRPSGWPTASAGVSYRTLSGTTASDTLSYVSSDWNGSNFSATRAFSTFSAFSVPGAAQGAGATYAASSLTKANLCTGAYTAKSTLNSAGTTIGGKSGMMRLW